MKKFVLLFSFLVSFVLTSYSQNLDSIPKSKRNSLLKSMATAIVMKHGPEYYRDEIKIKRIVMLDHLNMHKIDKQHIGEPVYQVIFLYDSRKERFEMKFAASVTFWGITGKPRDVTFGNGIGLSFDIPADKNQDFKNSYDPLPLKKK